MISTDISSTDQKQISNEEAKLNKINRMKNKLAKKEWIEEWEGEREVLMMV